MKPFRAEIIESPLHLPEYEMEVGKVVTVIEECNGLYKIKDDDVPPNYEHTLWFAKCRFKKTDKPVTKKEKKKTISEKCVEEIFEGLLDRTEIQNKDTITDIKEKIKNIIETNYANLEPEWIVNSIGELGVKVNNKCFFLYKGRNIVYKGEDAEDIMYRAVGKREFGEVCHPIKYYDKNGMALFGKEYKVELSPGIGNRTID